MNIIKNDKVEEYWMSTIFYGWIFFIIVAYLFLVSLGASKLFAIIPSILFGAIASVYLIGFPLRIFLNIKNGCRKVKETVFCLASFLGLTWAWYWLWQVRHLL